MVIITATVSLLLLLLEGSVVSRKKVFSLNEKNTEIETKR